MNREIRIGLVASFLAFAGIRCDHPTPSDVPAEEVASSDQAVLVATPAPEAVESGAKLAVNMGQVCAVVGDNSALKCWGRWSDGTVRGDQPGEMGDALPLLDLGTYAVPKINEVAIGGPASNVATICVTREGVNGDYFAQCWGDNSRGQLGLGDRVFRKVPVNPVVPLPAYRVAVGYYHVCRLPGNAQSGPTGSVYCLGYNAFGQLGSGTATPMLGDHPSEIGAAEVPVQLGTGRRAKSIAVGKYHSCALLDNNQVKCWGSNSSGQLGLGDTRDRGTAQSDMGDNLPFVPLGTGRYATAISAAGDFTCASLDNGITKCWGFGSYLATGTTANFGDQPNELGDNPAWTGVAMPGAKNLVSGGASTGGHTCLTNSNGLATTCWGANNQGQLGLGDTTTRGADPNDFFAGTSNLRNCQPDLGTIYGASVRVEALAAGVGQTCAIISSGSVYRQVKCWGGNGSGILGLGDLNARGDNPNEMGNNLPRVDLGSRSVAWLEDAKDPFQDAPIAVGTRHSCAILNNMPNRTSGPVKCWGDNRYGELGLGDVQPHGTGTGQMGDALPYVDLGPGRTAKRIAIAHGNTCAILDDDSLRCWGYNSEFEPSSGASVRGDVPGEMGSNLPAIALGAGRKAVKLAVGLASACALLDDNKVKCWGENTYGQLGIGSTTNQPAPTTAIDFGTSSRILNIKAGDAHYCALFQQNSGYGIKCWGLNAYGQLGLGATNSRGDQSGEIAVIPMQSAGDMLALGARHTCVGQSGPSGFVKCWGDNSSGQLGLGDTTSRGNVPSQIIGTMAALPPLGMTAQKLWAGREITCAFGIDAGTDGTNAGQRVKCWGRNTYGLLGLGDTANRGVLTGQVGPSLSYLDLGLNRSVGITSLAIGWVHACAVVQATGQVKCWGDNRYGALGLGPDLSIRGDAAGEMGTNLPFTPLGFEAMESTDRCPGLDDNNPCTTDACNPVTATVTHVNLPDATLCTDNNACTTADKCVSGKCTGTATVIDDLRSCTVDSCDTVTGVVKNVPVNAGTACNDGNPCTVNDVCSPAGTCVGSQVITPPPGQCSYSACNPSTGALTTVNVPAGTICNADNNLCTQAAANAANPMANDACNGSGQCIAGATATVPSDGLECTTDACDPLTGFPTHKPIAQQSHTHCGATSDTTECDGAGRCVAPLGAVLTAPTGSALPVIGEGSVAARTAVLYAGADAIQKKLAGDTAPFSFDQKRISVVQGRVLATDSLPLAKVRITIKDHPEYGYTETRVDGKFDLVVEGGGQLTVNYERANYFPAQRAIRMDWDKAGVVEDVVLVKPDLAAEPQTTVALCTSNCNMTAPMNIHVGGITSAGTGSRGAVILFPSSAQAQLNSSTQTSGAISSLKVAATEYTRDVLTGESTALPFRDPRSSGSLAMPGELPPASGYTYAVDLFDTTLLSDSTADVRFSGTALPILYVDNFVGFKVGSTVPVGSYDKTRAAWKSEVSGKVIKLLSVNATNQTVTVDTDGNGLADVPSDMKPEELNALYRLTTATYNSRFKVNDTLWRVAVAHFSPWDLNWPYGPQTCGEGGPCSDDDPGAAQNRDSAEDKPNCKPGSTIMCESRVLGESIPIAGTGWELVYTSERVPGYKAPLQVEITPPGTNHSSPAKNRWMSAATYAGTSYFEHALKINPTTNNCTVYVPTPKDRFGRVINGTVLATTEVVEHYPAVYSPGNTFGMPGNGPRYADVLADRARAEVKVVHKYSYPILTFDSTTAGLGGWDLSIHHWLDRTGGWIFRGDGTRQKVTPLIHMMDRPILGTTGVYATNPDRSTSSEPPDGSNWGAITLGSGIAAAPNGDLYVNTLSNGHTYQISWDKSRVPCTVQADIGPCIRRIGGTWLNATAQAVPNDGSDIPALTARRDGVDRQMVVAPDESIYFISGAAVYRYFRPKYSATGAILKDVRGLPLMNTSEKDSGGTLIAWRAQKIAGYTQQLPTEFNSGAPIVGIGDVAVNAQYIGRPMGLAVGADGAVFVLTAGVYPYPGSGGEIAVLLKIDADGILRTLIGGGTDAFDESAVTVSRPRDAFELKNVRWAWGNPMHLALAPNGDLYFGDTNLYVLRRGGRIEQLTQGVANAIPIDGGLSTIGNTLNSRLGGVAVAADGSVILADTQLAGLRRIDANGIITTIGGVLQGSAGQMSVPEVGGPAVPALLVRMTSAQIAISPSGDIFAAQLGGLSGSGLVRYFRAAGPVGQQADCVPSTDGAEVYCFDLNGRHLDTRDAKTCVNKDVSTCTKKYTFTYESPTSGNVASVMDAADNGTVLTRTATQVEIAPPIGGRTTLVLDASGKYLTKVTDPAAGEWTVTMSADGLLQRIQDPRGTHRHEFTYDDRGKLNTDALVNVATSAAEASQKLETSLNADNQLVKNADGSPKSPATYANNVTHTSAEGVATNYEVLRERTGKVTRTTTYLPTSLRRTVLENPDGTVVSTDADKVVHASTSASDPLFGANAPLITTTTTFPSGRKVDTRRQHVHDAASDSQSISVGPTGGTVRTATRTWTASGRTLEQISPANRRSTVVLDDFGRPTSIQEPGYLPTRFFYDLGNGTLSQVTARGANTLFSYFPSGISKGYLQAITSPTSVTTFDARNGLGLPLSQTTTGLGLDSSIVTGYGWDKIGNLTGITPPGKTLHTQGFTGFSQLASYVAPAMSSVTSNTTMFTYDADRGLSRVTRPGRAPISYVKSAGRLDGVVVGALQAGSPAIAIEYYGASETGGGASPGHIRTISGLGPVIGGPPIIVDAGVSPTLTYTYDGSLPLKEAYSGPVNGSVARTYDDYLNPATQTVVAGVITSTVTFTTDADGVVTSATVSGANLMSDYDDPSQNYRLKSTNLGNTASTMEYDSYGTLASIGYNAGASSFFQAKYDTPRGGTADAAVARDALGRIWKTKETRSDGVAHSLVYGYDAAGRLTSVTEDNGVVENYSYDANGNRTDLRAGPVGTSYDAQDRLINYAQFTSGGTKFWGMAYTDDGALSALTDLASGQATRYSYDELGNLVKVVLGDNTTIDYIIDGRGRRVGKKRNGVLVKTWLYDGQLRIAAELDVASNVLLRFVYANRSNIPDFMVKYTNSTTSGIYRIVSDHLGSPRMVVNAANASDRLLEARYTAFGIPTAISGSLSTIPFGFAGGLYDADTGLVRFGARDYDARFGRWTHKDPILFDGGQANLYAYVGNDPVNFVDPTGLDAEEWFLRNADTMIYASLGVAALAGATAAVLATGGTALQTLGSTELSALRVFGGTSSNWVGLGSNEAGQLLHIGRHPLPMKDLISAFGRAAAGQLRSKPLVHIGLGSKHIPLNPLKYLGYLGAALLPSGANEDCAKGN